MLKINVEAANSVEVASALVVNQKSPVLVGSGSEPYVIGAAFALDVLLSAGSAVRCDDGQSASASVTVGR